MSAQPDPQPADPSLRSKGKTLQPGKKTTFASNVSGETTVTFENDTSLTGIYSITGQSDPVRGNVPPGGSSTKGKWHGAVVTVKNISSNDCVFTVQHN